MGENGYIGLCVMLLFGNVYSQGNFVIRQSGSYIIQEKNGNVSFWRKCKIYEV